MNWAACFIVGGMVVFWMTLAATIAAFCDIPENFHRILPIVLVFGFLVGFIVTAIYQI